MSDTRYFVQLHFIVLLWGFTAILGVLISLPPVELVFYRTLLSSIGLLGVIVIGHRNWKIRRKDLLAILFTGLLFAIHWILFFAAARVSNVSVTLTGMATGALWTAFLEPIFSRKKVKPFEVILGLIVIAGLYIVFQADLSYRDGLIMAVISAFVAAIFTILNSRFTVKYDPYVITFYEMIGATLIIGLFLPFYQKYFTESGTLNMIPVGMDWVYLLILSMVCTVYAYSASVKLLKHLTPYAINLIINLEPIYGIILALIIFGEKEKMGINFYLGASLIILSVLIYPILNRINKQKALKIDNLR